jgi:hypothetical protein
MADMSGERITIKGDLVQLEELIVTRQVPLKDWLENVNISTPTTLPTLGSTQRFGHIDKNPEGHWRYFVLTEIPAGIKQLLKTDGRGGETRRYRVSTPWTYIWLVATSADRVISSTSSWSITDYRAFFANERYISPETEMISAILPNIYRNGRICWGATGADVRANFSDRIDQLTNEFYLTRFNTDLDGEMGIPNGALTYRQWVDESRADVSCWKNWTDWQHADKFNVGNLMATDGAEPRSTPIVLNNSIPEIPIRLTYGRWEEWLLENIPREELARLRVTMGNIDWETVLAGVTTPAPDVDNDDGGVVVENPR